MYQNNSKHQNTDLTGKREQWGRTKPVSFCTKPRHSSFARAIVFLTQVGLFLCFENYPLPESAT